MDELAWRVQAFAAMTEQAWGVGLGVEIEEEGTVDHGQTTVEYVKAAL